MQRRLIALLVAVGAGAGVAPKAIEVPDAAARQESTAPDLPPAPYTEVAPWGPEIEGTFEWEPAGFDTDRTGRVYVLRRSDPAVVVLDASGKLLRSFGTALFVWAHGISVDRQGNVWGTDCALGPSASAQAQLQPRNTAAMAAGRGHQVYKLGPDGTLLLTLGKAGQPGEGPDQFHCPSDVIVAADGSIFVADGHEVTPNARIVKFTRDGTFIKAWGRRGTAPGEFVSPHTLAFDSRGRLFVGDRGNRRIQIFDLDGHLLDQYTGFGAPSGIAITADDTMFVTDVDQRVVYVGNAKTGKTTGLIRDVWGEGVAADNHGNVYVGEAFTHRWRKFSRK